MASVGRIKRPDREHVGDFHGSRRIESEQVRPEAGIDSVSLF